MLLGNGMRLVVPAGSLQAWDDEFAAGVGFVHGVRQLVAGVIQGRRPNSALSAVQRPACSLSEKPKPG